MAVGNFTVEVAAHRKENSGSTLQGVEITVAVEQNPVSIYSLKSKQRIKQELTIVCQAILTYYDP